MGVEARHSENEGNSPFLLGLMNATIRRLSR